MVLGVSKNLMGEIVLENLLIKMMEMVLERCPSAVVSNLLIIMVPNHLLKGLVSGYSVQCHLTM